MPEQRPDDLAVFLHDAAAAVVAGQARLDAVATPAYLRAAPLPGQRFFYAIPRAAFDVRFAATVDKRGRILFIPRRLGTREQHTHALRFELVAVPEPPAPLAEGDTAEVVEPDFLLSRSEETRLRDLLARSLRAPAGRGVWRFRDPARDAGLARKVRRLADEIAVATELVHFCLDDGLYLVVLVGSKGKKDGLFLLRPEGEPRVLIDTFAGDGVRATSYEPLHLLARAVRRWLADDAEVRRWPWRPAGGGLGLADLDAFVAGVGASYRHGLGLLAREGAAAQRRSSALLPSFYDLAGVEATVSFSIDVVDRKASLSDRPEDGAAAEVDNQVTVRVERREGAPRLTVELEQMEFVLKGAARRRFLDQAAKAGIEDAFAGDAVPRARYRELLASDERRRGVVVFRSHRPKTFVEDLLVIWPGIDDRDFVFTCVRRGGGLEEVKPVLRLGQTLAEAGPVAPEDDGPGATVIGRDQYAAFHKFFAAVLVWRRRA